MTTLKTCLLISDDPDDHFEFSEALHETSDDVVLLSVFDSQKILELLQQKKVIPDFIFLDLSVDGSILTKFSDFLRADKTYSGTRLVPYGNDFAMGKPRSPNITSLPGKDFSYSELKEFLKGILTQS